MLLPCGVLVLVADGGRMLLLRNDGDAVAPQLAVIEHRQSPAPRNRDLFADAPGRSFSSHSPTRSTYDDGDAHAARERGFLAAACASLAENIAADTPGIVVAADPVSLGYVRDHYPPAVKALLLAELDKDLTGMTVDAIARHLVQTDRPANF
jgi:protein required for attachment to host cells